MLGGAAVTEEIYPGFKYSVAPTSCRCSGPRSSASSICRATASRSFRSTARSRRCRAATTCGASTITRKTRREIARHSKVDAEAYEEYGKAMVEMGRFVKPILNMTPPDPTSLNPRGLMDLAFLGRRFQALSDQDKYNQVQLMTMSAVDFLDQWFETDVLKATMSASGIIGTFLGVRSPGTAYVLLHHYMGEIDGAFRSWGLSRGGTGAISECDRRRRARSRRRDPDRDRGVADSRQGRRGGGRRARERRLLHRERRGLEPRPAPDLHRSWSARTTCRRSSSRTSSATSTAGRRER